MAAYISCHGKHRQGLGCLGTCTRIRANCIEGAQKFLGWHCSQQAIQVHRKDLHTYLSCHRSWSWPPWWHCRTGFNHNCSALIGCVVWMDTCDWLLLCCRPRAMLCCHLHAQRPPLSVTALIWSSVSSVLGLLLKRLCWIHPALPWLTLLDYVSLA